MPAPQRLESIGRTLAIIAGSLFSPTLPLMKWLLMPYVNIDALLASGFTDQTPVDIVIYLHALGPEILLTRIAPILALGCVLGILYLTLCGHLGLLLTRHLILHWQTAVPE